MRTKSTTVFIISVLLILVLLSPKAQSQNALLMDEGFEGAAVGRDNPKGWDVFEGHAACVSVVETPVHSGTKAMKLVGVSFTEDRMSAGFETEALIVAAELYTQAAQTAKISFSMTLANGDAKNPEGNAGNQDRALIVRFLETGQIGWSHGANIPDGMMPYVENKWYHIKVTVNFEDKNYDIYVDDMTLPKEADVPLTNPHDTLNYICFHFPGAWGGVCYVDDIRIYEGEQLGKSVDAVGKKTVVWGYLKQQTVSD